MSARPMTMPLRSALLRGLLLCMLLHGVAALADESGGVPQLVRVEPPRDSARHLGDVVSYRALLRWPAGWDIDRDGLPLPTRDDAAIELRGHAIEEAGGACTDCRWLELRWQVFKAVRMSEDVLVPAIAVRLRNGTEVASVQLPPARLAVSPQVPWERRKDWLDSIRPGWIAGRYDERSRWLEAAGWGAVAVIALIGWGWASGRWFVRRRVRPFADAWRALRSRRRPHDGGPPQADADDLRRWHRAFDATAGESVFPESLDAFFTAHPAYAPLADDIRAVFEISRRRFFLAPDIEDGLAVTRLLDVLRRLADIEFRPGRTAAHHAQKTADAAV